MKIYSWNVNGIRAACKNGNFQAFIDKYQPDILGLQETKALQGQAEIDLTGYEEYWNSAGRLGYSGTAIFSKIKPISVSYDLPEEIVEKFGPFSDKFGDVLAEGRVTTAEFENFYYISVYTPNSKNDLTRLKFRHEIWDPAFLAYVLKLEAVKPVIFSGDLNVAHTPDDLANPKPNEGKHGYTQEERDGFTKYIDAGFIDSFRMFKQGNGYYTWWTHWANARARNVGWRIDYFVASGALKNKIKSSEIYPNVMGSDHCPISIELSI